jgi:hypothetical protein
VTGDSRFLNEINGKIDWSNILSKPTIPAAANNGTLTIQKNGTNVQTFTANQSTNATANITVPTKVSELTNDSGYTNLTIGTTATTAMAGNTNVNNVTQTNTTDNADYRVLLSYGANDTTQTNTIQKNTNLKYNPSTGNLQTTKLNGVTVGSSPKFTDTNTHRPIKINGSTILENNTAPFNLVSGDNVRMAITGSGSVTIHSDQIDDSYTYSQYQDLPDSIKMQDKIFMVKDAPNPSPIPIVDEYAREQIADVKSDLTKLGFGTMVGLGGTPFPYTATEDCIIIMRLRGSNAAQLAYWYATVDGEEVGALVSTSGAHVTCSTPLAKGKTIKTSAYSNAIIYAYVVPMRK